MTLRKGTIRLILCTIIGFLGWTNQLEAQTKEQTELFTTLQNLDRLLFEVGFNQCQLEQVKTLIDEDFEFYHDKDGIIMSRESFLMEFKKNICESGTPIFQRKLVDGTLKVFPLYEHGELYGAIQTGVHQFDNTTAKFTHLWQLKGGEWRATRMMSYDHTIEEITFDTKAPFIEMAESELETYLGQYAFSPDFVLTILIEGDRVYGDAQGQKIEVKACGNNKFLDIGRTTELDFILDQNNEVIGLTMTTPEGQMNAEKVN